jgi:hypothetical protein
MHWQSVAVAKWLRLRGSAPEAAADFARTVAARAGRRWNRAKVKDSTRHWFEVGHADYLRAVERTIHDFDRRAVSGQRVSHE